MLSFNSTYLHFKLLVTKYCMQNLREVKLKTYDKIKHTELLLDKTPYHYVLFSNILFLLIYFKYIKVEPVLSCQSLDEWFSLSDHSNRWGQCNLIN